MRAPRQRRQRATPVAAWQIWRPQRAAPTRQPPPTCPPWTPALCRSWDGGNNPEQTDYVSVSNLIKACPPSLKRFTLTTSAGVERSGQFPFAILNLFGESQGRCFERGRWPLVRRSAAGLG